MNMTRILVVAGESKITEMVRFALGRRNPFHVREERDFSNGTATARTYKPSLIVLDVDSPTGRGREVADSFKFDSVLCTVPIVRVSSQPAERVAAARAGALFLPKSADANCVAEVINAALIWGTGVAGRS